MTAPKTETKLASRLWLPLAIIGVILIVLITVLSLFIGGSPFGPKTIHLTKTPALTGTPIFVKQQTPGFKIEANPQGAPKTTIRLTKTNPTCTATLATGYLPENLATTGNDDDLTRAYLKLITGGVPTLSKPAETTIPTTTGSALTFLQTHFNTDTKINGDTDTRISTYFAVRVINHKLNHKTYTQQNTAADETATTQVLLIATYQCTGTAIETADWENLINAQKIKL